MEQVLHEILIPLCEHGLSGEFLLEALLLEGGLHLVLVLNSLSSDGFLLRNALFVALPPLLAHTFLLPQSLLIALEFKLNLVFGPALAHLGLILHCLSLLLVFNLSPLDLKLLCVLGDL